MGRKPAVIHNVNLPQKEQFKQKDRERQMLIKYN